MAPEAAAALPLGVQVDHQTTVLFQNRFKMKLDVLDTDELVCLSIKIDGKPERRRTCWWLRWKTSASLCWAGKRRKSSSRSTVAQLSRWRRRDAASAAWRARCRARRGASSSQQRTSSTSARCSTPLWTQYSAANSHSSASVAPSAPPSAETVPINVKSVLISI